MGKSDFPVYSCTGRVIAHTILPEVSHARYEFAFFIQFVVFEVEIFSFKEVLHSIEVGECGIECVGINS